MGKIAKVRILTRVLAAMVLMAGSQSFGGDLIEPTRTLEDGEQRWGSLTVFSEPPELEVYLDGKEVGKTPLWLEKVKAGPHVLKVEGEEAEIYVGEGKPMKIGLFKGSFVSFPEKEKEEEPIIKAKQPAQAPQVERPREEQRARDLTMWEMIIGGSSRR